MRRVLAATLALTLLSGCATILTPARCERALSGLQTAADIAAALIRNGVAPVTAQKVADAISLSQLGVGAACASVRG